MKEMLQLIDIDCFSGNKININPICDVYTKKRNPEDVYNAVIFDNCIFYSRLSEE